MSLSDGNINARPKKESIRAHLDKAKNAMRKGDKEKIVGLFGYKDLSTSRNKGDNQKPYKEP